MECSLKVHRNGNCLNVLDWIHSVELFILVLWIHLMCVHLLNLYCYFSKTYWNCRFFPLILFRIHSKFSVFGHAFIYDGKKVIFSKFSAFRLQCLFCCDWYISNIYTACIFSGTFYQKNLKFSV